MDEIDKEKHKVKKKQGISNPFSKRLFTIKESAFYLGRGVYGIREMIWSGKLPVVRDGRKMFIDIRDLDNWISNNKNTYN